MVKSGKGINERGDKLTVKEAVIYLEKLLKHETPISSNFFKLNGGINNGT